MNIFAVDRNPVAAARALCDRHVVKMTLETAQILCTVVGDAPYRATHRAHPCVIWAGTRRANFEWLVRHGIALADEYRRRYDRTHKSEKVIRWATGRGPRKGGRRDPFVQAMPEKYRGEDPVAAYRRYYLGEKAGFAEWRYTRPPAWWLDSRARGRYSPNDVEAPPRAATKAERDRARAVYRRAGDRGRNSQRARAVASHRSAGQARGRRK